MKNWTTLMAALCAGLLPHTALCGAFDDYRYELVRGEQHDVCRHMLGVYNQYFSARPHDFRQVTEVNGVTIPKAGKDDLWLFQLKSSFYPSSPEFEAVKWQIGTRATFPPSDTERPRFPHRAFIFSHLDIDNDGQEEVVVKTQFNLGEKDGFEGLRVFAVGEVDLSSRIVPLTMLHEGIDGKHPPQIIGNPAMIRPFIHQGVVYLHQYDYRRLGQEGDGPSDADEPYTPPETVTIWKFLNTTPGTQERGKAQKDIQCEYRMEVTTRQQ